MDVTVAGTAPDSHRIPFYVQSDSALDGIFDDAQAWGTDTIKGWIHDYESTRFTAVSYTHLLMKLLPRRRAKTRALSLSGQAIVR